VGTFERGMLCCLALLAILCLSSGEEPAILDVNRPNVYGTDYIRLFYDRIKQSDAKYCTDRTKMLPDCTLCIPGLRHSKPESTSCDAYLPSSSKIRQEIRALTVDRYGANGDQSVEGQKRYPRPFGLYPYLEKGDFMIRQEIFGKMLDDNKAKNVVDIGAYYNPINVFMQTITSMESTSHCVESVVIVEPILDALSVMLPCKAKGFEDKFTHIIFLPVTFRHYAKEIVRRMPTPAPDSIVCIGCDGHYGPSRRMLEETFPRPFTIYLEYPTEYYHNPPFNKMMGKGAKEEMIYHKLFQPHTNETTFTKRAMKVIQYNKKE
jgi:hypothetical protein